MGLDFKPRFTNPLKGRSSYDMGDATKHAVSTTAGAAIGTAIAPGVGTAVGAGIGLAASVVAKGIKDLFEF